MSKALEKIELLKSLANDGRIAYDTTKYNEWLKTIEKPLKALEVIKRNPMLVISLLTNNATYKYVVETMNESERPTQEEYDLLKEFLL